MWSLPVVAAVGGTLGNLFNINQQGQINRDQITLSKEQMDWQARMSNTAHQREVKDLQAAGLNPVLSAGGNGAGTPSGSVPNLQVPQVDMPGIFSAIQGMQQLEQQDRRISIESRMADASIAKANSDVLTDTERRKLLKRGLIRSDLEGEASGFLRQMLDRFKSPGNPFGRDKRNDEILREYEEMIKHKAPPRKRHREEWFGGMP